VNEATYVHILEQMSDGVAVFTQDGTFKYVNRAFQEMTGYDLKAMQLAASIVMPGLETDKDTIARLEAAIAAGQAFSGEILNYRKSGEPFWNAFSIDPHRNEDGSLLHFVYLMRDLTSQKRAEDKASKLERDYRFIFENVQSAITVHGADTQIRVANPIAVELLGIGYEDLAGSSPSDPIFELFREDGSEMPLEQYPLIRAINHRCPVRDVVLGFHRVEDDRRIWLVCSAFPVTSDDGDVLEVLLSFSDITRLVESEGENRALRERFELAARATQDAIFEWNIKTGEFWANEAYKTIYGYEPSKYIYLENLETSSAVEADHDLVRQTTLNAINSGKERYTLDYKFRRSDGLTGHAVVRGFIVRDAMGDAQRIIGTTTDVGQLTRANAALEQSEQRFRLIAGSASDVLWDHDFESGFTWSSPDWPSKLGVEFDPRKTQNFQWIEMVEPSGRQRLIASFQEAIKSDATAWETEFSAHSVDGQAIDLAVKGSILRHPNGRAYRILGNMRNVTQERRNQEGYTRARALEAVGQLTGGVAHDFNNLLMIILGNVELLEMTNLGEEDAETVASIGQAAESAARLTKQLLTFARQAQLNRTRVDVNALVSNTVPLLRSGLPETIRFSQSFVPDLWPVDVDANSLQQAIVNLAMNANDAMLRGGELIVTCSNLTVDEDMVPANVDLRPGRYVAISVSDTGEGMPPEVLARAFEPFFTTKDVGRGTGLGLSTVYGFAKQSNGGVSIYSEPGRGTTVNLYLPAAEGDASQDDHPEPAIEAAMPSRRKRILVVEDQPQVRTHVEKTLARLGYAVATAQDAAAALTMLKHGEAFDLLFTDIIMPGEMNGQELGEAALKLAPQIKILYTSGYPAAAFEHLGLKEQSSINFLSKPYKTVDLQRMLADIFDD
jgi:PAS domain S-box-containing protein